MPDADRRGGLGRVSGADQDISGRPSLVRQHRTGSIFTRTHQHQRRKRTRRNDSSIQGWADAIGEVCLSASAFKGPAAGELAKRGVVARMSKPNPEHGCNDMLRFAQCGHWLMRPRTNMFRVAPNPNVRTANSAQPSSVTNSIASKSLCPRIVSIFATRACAASCFVNYLCRLAAHCLTEDSTDEIVNSQTLRSFSTVTRPASASKMNSGAA